MENNKNVPEIRFKGFTNAWEQDVLANYMQRSNDEPLDVHSSTQLMSVKLNLKGVEVFSNSRDLKFGKTKYFKRCAGDFIYGKQNLFNGAFGIVPDYLDGYGTSGDVPTLKTYGDLNNKFLVYSLERCYKSLEQYSAGSGSKRIHEAKFLSFEISLPSLEEQERVVVLLNKINENIALHQRKLETLEKLKKSMLEKMFPKDGSDVPEIRFNGFTNAWEQDILGNICLFNKGKGYSKSSLTKTGVPIILYGQMYTNFQYVIEKTMTFVQTGSTGVFSTGNEVIVPASGETADDIARATHVKKSNVLLGGDLNIIYPKSKINPSFLAINLSNGNTQKTLASKAQGKSVVHLHKSDLECTKISYTSLIEQEKIVKTILCINSDIVLHQRKLEMLQNIKKSMLEKMFVS